MKFCSRAREISWKCSLIILFHHAVGLLNSMHLKLTKKSVGQYWKPCTVDYA
ncbi:hypothetical protein CASFOL_030671 [Castilleja foliolosa]|uniref:Uncharacterized protein n=1 Tax=Castilleja foliolosa TaxID=1961234 RepID=A0ABD3C8Z4_9LAMI